jgi:hypothetical protein
MINRSDYPIIATLIRLAFPDYRKRKVYLQDTARVTLAETYDSGGTRKRFVSVDLSTRLPTALPDSKPPQFGGPRVPPQVELNPGVVIVRGGSFCG